MNPNTLREGERRHATVLFSDMKGFTTFTEGRDPEEIDRLMGSLFSRFEGIIRRHGGSVEKYIGDALVAVFGVPRVHEDDAVRAIAAAIEFRESLAQEHPDLKFRTGIHSGLITTGKRGEYDVVTGHALAVASRLENAAEPGGILVSDDVFHVAKTDFTFSEPREIRARGREDSIPARGVRARLSQSTRDDEPFVGRDAILQELTRSYMQSGGETSASVVLVGDPGMGASRIAYRFVEEVREFPRFDSATVFVRPSPFSRSPYSAIWNAARDHFGVDEDSPDDIDSVFKDSVPSNQTADVLTFLREGQVDIPETQLFPLIAKLFSLMLGDASGIFRPLIVVDNIDELSPAERDLFRYLVNRGRVPGFYVATSNDRAGEAIDLLPNSSVLDVPPLSRAETAAFIMELKHGTPDDEFVDDVHARTGGNPTFVRELFRYLESNPTTGDIPIGIQTVVLAGVQTLPAEIQQLLQRLSVFDHPFRLEDARRLAGPEISENSIESLLDNRYTRVEGDRYTFVNELVRQSIYDSLLNHNKRVLHAAAAEAIESDDLPAVVRVRHLVKAGLHAEAATLLQELRGKVMNVDRLLLDPIGEILSSSIATDPDIRGELLYLRLAILFNTHASDEDIGESIRELLRLGISAHSSDLMGRAYAFLLGRYSRSGALHAARHAGYQALEHYGRAGMSVRIDSVLAFLSGVCRRMGLDDESDELTSRLENVSMKYVIVADHALLTQNFTRAAQLNAQSLEIAAESPPQIASFGIATATAQRVRLLIATRSWAELSAMKDQVEGLAGPWYGPYSTAFSGLAIAEHNLGRPAEAALLLERAEYYARQSRNEIFWFRPAIALATAQLELGHNDVALTGLERVFIDLAQEPYEEAIATILGLILRALGDSDPERSKFYLVDFESILEHMPVARDYDRMLALWFRYRLGDDPERHAALRSAQEIAAAILNRQDDSPFGVTMRSGWPYRDITGEAARLDG